MITMTKHAQHDRQERIDKIIDYCGGYFGTLIAEKENKGAWQVLYSTGIIMIYSNANKNRLVTMYLGTLDQITAIYRDTHNGQNMPKALYSIAKKANKLQKIINK